MRFCVAENIQVKVLPKVLESLFVLRTKLRGGGGGGMSRSG